MNFAFRASTLVLLPSLLPTVGGSARADSAASIPSVASQTGFVAVHGGALTAVGTIDSLPASAAGLVTW